MCRNYDLRANVDLLFLFIVAYDVSLIVSWFVCVSDQLSRLHMILKPFMLRRIKKDVENELSDKVEERTQRPQSPQLLDLLEQYLKLQ